LHDISNIRIDWKAKKLFDKYKTKISYFSWHPIKNKPLRGNGAASNDCLPYETFKSVALFAS
jgi:hypothetical protein